MFDTISYFINYSLDKIGSCGPMILFFKNNYLLYHKPVYYNFYILGTFLDLLINIIIKGLIRQPRPGVNLKLYNASNSYFHRFITKDGIPFDLYGMPSGHLQNVFFSTSYAMLVLKDKKQLYMDLVLCFITLYQRITYNFHTLFQACIGAFIGIITGYLFYSFAKRKLVGNLKLKQDDYAPK